MAATGEAEAGAVGPAREASRAARISNGAVRVGEDAGGENIRSVSLSLEYCL